MRRDSDLDGHKGAGGVRVDQVWENFRIRTNDGDIHMRDIEGQLDAGTHDDGNIHLSGRLDLANLRTGDGDIEAGICASSAPQPGWSLRTGDATLTCVSPTSSGEELYTGDGEVKIDFAFTASGPNKETTESGKINVGEIPTPPAT